jgi:hypothetical protein
VTYNHPNDAVMSGLSFTTKTTSRKEIRDPERAHPTSPYRGKVGKRPKYGKKKTQWRTIASKIDAQLNDPKHDMVEEANYQRNHDKQMMMEEAHKKDVSTLHPAMMDEKAKSEQQEALIKSTRRALMWAKEACEIHNSQLPSLSVGSCDWVGLDDVYKLYEAYQDTIQMDLDWHDYVTATSYESEDSLIVTNMRNAGYIPTWLLYKHTLPNIRRKQREHLSVVIYSQSSDMIEHQSEVEDWYDTYQSEQEVDEWYDTYQSEQEVDDWYDTYQSEQEVDDWYDTYQSEQEVDDWYDTYQSEQGVDEWEDLEIVDEFLIPSKSPSIKHIRNQRQ